MTRAPNCFILCNVSIIRYDVYVSTKFLSGHAPMTPVLNFVFFVQQNVRKYYSIILNCWNVYILKHICSNQNVLVYSAIVTFNQIIEN